MLYGIRPDEQRRLAAAGTPGARLRALRRRLVRLLHAPAGRAPGQPALLPALARQPQLLKRGPTMDAVTQVPAPVNEPVRTTPPAAPSAPRCEARLDELAGEPLELTMTIGGEQRMAGGERVRRRPAAPARRTCSGTSAHATARRRRRPRSRAAQGGRAGLARRCPSTTGPRSSSRPPTCWPARGGRRSTPPPCSASRKTALPGRDRRGLRADRLLALQRALRPADPRRAADLLARASGTGSTTGRSRASSTRSRRSTSPRSPATCRPRRR